jgi:PhnB protein
MLRKSREIVVLAAGAEAGVAEAAARGGQAVWPDARSGLMFRTAFRRMPMPNKVSPVPAGYHTVTPYISVKGAAKALEFYRRAFGAEVLVRMDMPDGRVGHAEIKIGDSHVMLADESDMDDAVAKSPETLGGTTCALMIYLDDVDARFKRAVDAGATVKRPVQDQFYGDRTGTLQDPFGHVWTLGMHVEDVSPDEMKRRMAAFAKGG